ncbi:MAG TPA: hypothetical protein VG365_07095 [Solirubrobacteraceae bacterium]|jgi:hypothetical protein|nr:hypothetical protein [Solirubrobacteraceae bacterium]
MDTMKNTTPQEEKGAHYEQPKITDYGTLLELTQAGTLQHSDVPMGAPNTSFVSG